jgi:hypothetical protein
VVDRQALDPATHMPMGTPRSPEVWESGFKDTVISYPGEVTRVRGRLDVEGLFVWLPYRRARGQRDDAALRDRTDPKADTLTPIRLPNADLPRGRPDVRA